MARLISKRRVPASIAVLGVLLGLLVGGVVVGVTYGQLTGAKNASATITETETVTTVASSGQSLAVTSTVSGGATFTTTVTAPGTGSSKAPTITLEPTELLYYAGDNVILIGTIYPPPTSSQGISVTTTNPAGTVVQVGEAETGISNGTFFFTLNTNTSSQWVSGTYSVTARSGTLSGSAVFYYAATQVARAPLYFQVVAPAAAIPGQKVDIAVLSSLSNGALDDVTSWSTFTVYFPDGTVQNLCAPPSAPSGCANTFARINNGFSQANFTLPATAPGGTYYVVVAGGDSSGNSAEGIAQFSVP